MRTFVLVFSLVVGMGATASAVEHRHDCFAKTVLPFLNIFAKERKTEDRAFALKFRIEQATDFPPELLGQTAEIVVETPDKLRLHGPLLGETFTIGRSGDSIWISPVAKARALLSAKGAGKELPPAEKKVELGEFKLPFSEKSLVFLPALFSVKDLGFETLEGVECRVLDVTLMPELADDLKVEGWIVRMWITPDHKPARVTVARKGWHLVARIEDVQFAKGFEPTAFRPTPDQQSDVLELSPKDYSRFLKAAWGAKARE